MRVMVFFDLPTDTAKERKTYRVFRDGLIKAGFMMMQQSVYTKLALNHSQVNKTVEKVKSMEVKNGLVQILVVTEKQYSRMEVICGKVESQVINTDDRLLVI